MVNWKLASPLCVADTSLRRASNGSPHPHFPRCNFHWIFPFKKNSLATVTSRTTVPSFSVENQCCGTLSFLRTVSS
ncbi:hypothetical protein PAHAL_1G077600 [Panicum hallii]|uniref:Uncharacterized protein n=1 Tax=Panicum hallii TaxID=206008 RepID=A0A2S3GMX0_9POAL|nr:hypothetical protein PAHAL_1G077600 [Panicum hallii]